MNRRTDLFLSFSFTARITACSISVFSFSLLSLVLSPLFLSPSLSPSLSFREMLRSFHLSHSSSVEPFGRRRAFSLLSAPCPTRSHVICLLTSLSFPLLLSLYPSARSPLSLTHPWEGSPL